MKPKRGSRVNKIFNPAIIILNLIVVFVVTLMIFFIYSYVNSDEKSSERTTPPPVSIARNTLVPLFSDPEPNSETRTEIAGIASSLEITKATTTTPAHVTSEMPSIYEITDNPVVPETAYDISYFENDLFIGDSIMTGFSLFGFLPKENVFAEVGLNPETALKKEIDGVNIADKTAAMKPEKIFIMLGTNGLAFLSPEYMAKKMSELTELLKKSSPDSGIIVMTIPPVTKEHDENKPEKNSEIISYNKLITAFANENNYGLADIYSLLKTDKGYLSDKYAEQDGLHFLSAAYKAVLRYLQEEN